MKLTSYMPAGQTLVSNRFIDRYMAGASGEYVKVYLYLLRLQSEPEVSVTLLADRLELTEKDVMRALRYWETARLISLQKGKQGELSGITLLTEQREPEEAGIAGQEMAEETAGLGTGKASAADVGTAGEPEAGRKAEGNPGQSLKGEQTATAEVQPAPRRSYTLEEMGKLEKQEDFSLALIAAEQYLQRTLTRRDTDLLAYLYDELGFPGDLLEYLVEYCVNGKKEDIRKASFVRYIESVALGWHREGVRTLEQAKAAGRDFGEAGMAVVKAFGIRGRNLTEAERLRIERWQKELGMSPEMIKEACARTMDSIHEASFPYAEKILSSWAEKKLTSLKAVKEQDAGRRETAPRETRKNKNEYGNFAYQRQTDYDALLSRETSYVLK